MSYRLVKVQENLTLSRKLLQQHRDLPNVPGERELETSRLRFIGGLLEKGLFNRCEWASCKCKEDGKTYRVNGQHTGNRLNEILEGKLEAEFPTGIPVVYQQWECDSLTDLGLVFDQFDHHKAVRKSKDRLGIYMAEFPDVRGQISKEFCGNILAGISWGARSVPEIQSTIPTSLLPSEAYDRGKLLNNDSVRLFIVKMSDHDNAPFRQWSNKAGVVATFFKTYLEGDTEEFNLLIEQTLWEVGDKASNFTRKIRQECQKTGKTPEHFYKLGNKYVKEQMDELRDMTKSEKEKIKQMIREVLTETEEEDEELIVAQNDD